MNKFKSLELWFQIVQGAWLGVEQSSKSSCTFFGPMSPLLVAVAFAQLLVKVFGFNVDLDHAVIIENPNGNVKSNYFGYSLVLFNDKKSKERW